MHSCDTADPLIAKAHVCRGSESDACRLTYLLGGMVTMVPVSCMYLT